ncbi:hypothetical protein L596_009579 [Steinernema carpocapsae]|uniref:LicD/FKTN/FKRP nucleotidyltransferase domain-containing protein n=1 Tax=Steinernema carpocapsae TaxID=34508 RepID=A0A4U5PH27_STECR|nr:hypothetical protein L596_009579 [Steinernema carpocapsae]
MRRPSLQLAGNSRSKRCCVLYGLTVLALLGYASLGWDLWTASSHGMKPAMLNELAKASSEALEQIRTQQNLLADIPVHIKDLFAVKELKLVALDPVLLTCLTTGKCMQVTASARIQLGTWVKNTEEFQKVFKTHFKDATWKLKVLGPNAAVITKHYWRGFDKKIALSVIQDDPEKHYLKIEMEKNAEIEERAFDRFNTTQLLGLTVPSDIPRFELWWKNGRFLNCNETLAKNFVANSSIIQEIHVQNLKIFTDMLLASDQIPTLAFGTLLGWYRNCGVIPYTTDIDITVPISQYKDDFVEGLMKRKDFKITRLIGRKEYGLEYTVNIPGIVKDAYVDVFYMFPHNSTYDLVIVTGEKTSKWIRLKTLIPKNSSDEYCTGDIMGYLFFVPCNFMDVIVAAYGKTDWLTTQLATIDSFSTMATGTKLWMT